MNRTLNWGTSIISAIFLFVGGKYLGNSFSTDSIFFKYITLLFIIYIVVFAIYKLYTMNYSISINMLITDSYKNINYFKTFSTYTQINNKAENSQLLDYYSEKIQSYSKDLRKGFNPTIIKEKTNEIEKIMNTVIYLFGAGISIFLLFIISFPIYFFFH